MRQRALHDLSAEIDLHNIVDSWQDTLPDEQIPTPKELERRVAAVPDHLRF
jgi:hypothetical protein